MNEKSTYDVAIVGYGPIGQSLAILMGQRGYNVAVFERWPDLYPLPRAVFHDHEIRRIFHAMGVGQEVAAISQPSAKYQWFNADWKTLVEIDWSAESISDGPFGYLFNQPSLEVLLNRKARSLPNVQVFQGWEAVGLSQDEDGCVLTVRGGTMCDGAWQHSDATQTIRASYVVGADGANSFVRRASGIEYEDFGFEEDWLVIDVKPNPGVTLDVPDIGQWCNPARPTTMVPGGPGYRRWEFMRLPGESVESLQSPEKVWSLLSHWVTPENATLVRHAVYKFRSLLAARWHHGRVVLAGDAAHLMPPFMGQGMCSGVRDAWNLAWRLQLILSGAAQPSLLDTYTCERRPQVRAVIDASIEMGQVVCISDPEAAARRDDAYLSGRVPPLPPFPGIVEGMIQRTVGVNDPHVDALAGTLSHHAKVSVGGKTLRYDDAVRNGFHVITYGADAVIDDEARALLARIGGTAVRIDPPDVPASRPAALIDVEGKYGRFFADSGVAAIVVRPDFYIYGAVGEMAALPDLLDRLRRDLVLVA